VLHQQQARFQQDKITELFCNGKIFGKEIKKPSPYIILLYMHAQGMFCPPHTHLARIKSSTLPHIFITD